MTKKVPNPVDVAVGQRVRLLRMERGLSQERLAEALGVTFQQVQKYEKGINRIGASRLQLVATSLGISVASLFPETDAPAANLAPFDASTLRVARNFQAISDPALRRGLAQTIAAAAGAPAESAVA